MKIYLLKICVDIPENGIKTNNTKLLEYSVVSVYEGRYDHLLHYFGYCFISTNHYYININHEYSEYSISMYSGVYKVLYDILQIAFRDEKINELIN